MPTWKYLLDEQTLRHAFCRLPDWRRLRKMRACRSVQEIYCHPMPPCRSFPHSVFITALAVGGFAALNLQARADDKIDFEKQILPILDASCFKCHSAQAKKVDRKSTR